MTMNSTNAPTKPGLKRPHYATTTVRRMAYEQACEAQMEARRQHRNMIDFVSTALDRMSAPILRRRLRRLNKLAACPSSQSLNHKVTTQSTAHL